MKLREVQKEYPDWHFTEIGIDKNHVHVNMVIWIRCIGIAAASGQPGILCPRP